MYIIEIARTSHQRVGPHEWGTVLDVNV
eukprot:SAG11_NODE_20245_length_449_cov_1.885714_1_plen_27_part_01